MNAGAAPRLELKGVSVAPGIGIGRIVVVVEAGQLKVPRRQRSGASAEQALERFEQARQRAVEDLRSVQAATARELGEQDAAIYGAQIAVLHDPDALRSIRTAVRQELLEPESAIQELLDRFERLFKKLEGGEVKNWAADLRDPWLAVLHQLSLEEEGRVAAGEGRALDPAGLILAAEELTPSLVTRYPRQSVAGLVCARGGRFSHGAVLARSYGIPAVIGLNGVHEKAANGEIAVVYGEDGRVLLGVPAEQERRARRLSEERRRVRSFLDQAALQPGMTADGTAVEILVNIESPRDLSTFDPNIAAGIGLFRTEFAYMERASFPGSREQLAIYQAVLQRFAGKPVTFRTLDVGGDKQLRYLTLPQERNPALGWRGLRLSLEWGDLFLIQVSALIEARQQGDARVLLPMVTTIEELRRAQRMIGQAAEAHDRGAGAIPVGVMIEVPAAAMALADLAAEADFVSVGTNDLTQYLFAVDRDNPWVADLYQPYHPAHLRVLQQIAKTCSRLGKPCSVCGEMAGQAAGALYLVGAGFRSLSMAAPFVPEVKALLREVPLAELARLAEEAARCHTSGEALAILQGAAERYWQAIVARAAAER